VKINIIICFLLVILFSANANDTNDAFEMVLIPGGTNSGTDPDFGAYSLTVGSFYMHSKEVTKEQWDEVYNWAITNGYTFYNSGDGRGSQIDHPVNNIHWYDCATWCNARSEMDGRTPCYAIDGGWVCDTSKNGYRLPSTDEWKYAARGGVSGKRFPWGDTIDFSNANYRGSLTLPYDLSGSPDTSPIYHYNPTPYTSPVGSFAPNGYGLYDMAGNVQEWCNTESPDPEITWHQRGLMGGTWLDYANYMRCGFDGWGVADDASYTRGFRCVTSEWHFPATFLYIN
jgi:formylglycine-generating enzyme required for sulfatase activity